MPMKTHYVVRSVLLSRNTTAVTLEPGKWYRESNTETEEIDGEDIPALEEVEPADATEPFSPEGGKMTELRFEDDDPGFRPGDFVTVDAYLSPRNGKRKAR